jgi:hypothetical protein
MTTTTTPFEQLPELYLGTLVSDAYYEGFAGTIVSAINSWHDVVEILQPDQQSQRRPHQVNAASTLTHHAMGLLEHCVSGVSHEIIDQQRDWARIDRFWDEAATPAEVRWVHEQLQGVSTDVWDLFRCHRREDWSQDLAMAATFLQAAALLLAGAFGIEGVQA